MMMMFGVGAALPIAVLGTASRQAMNKLRSRLLSAGSWGKNVLGMVLVVLGVSILTHVDKRLEAFLVQHSPAWLTDLTVRY